MLQKTLQNIENIKNLSSSFFVGHEQKKNAYLHVTIENAVHLHSIITV